MTRGEQLQTFMTTVPIAQTLGMRCEIRGDDMIAVLPFQKKLIGNYTIQALHGGAIGTFLEMTAMAQLFLESDTERPARTINITIDYLRQGKAEDLFARAIVVKQGRRIASVRAEAWQAKRTKPVAVLSGHFKL